MLAAVSKNFVCRHAFSRPRQGIVISRVMASTASNAEPASTKQVYGRLCEKLKDLNALSGISGLLDWDQMVMMPEGGADSRGTQKAALAGVLHDKQTDPELGSLLAQLKAALTQQQEGADGALDAWESATVREAQKDYVKATAIPKELAQRIARLESESYQAWMEAKKASDFSKFAPFLQQWVEVNKEKARCINAAGNPYDVLLDDYESGMTSARLDQIFGEVRAGLVPLIASIKAKGANSLSDACLKGTFDVDTQAKLAKAVALDMGFDINCGRLDTSAHPFTANSHPTDVRITTRFKPDDVSEGLTGVIHEAGHALYEQGRNLQYDGLPVNRPMSMGVHESQSLLWERMVALSQPFQSYLLPRLKEFFPASFSSSTPEQLYTALNVVKEPSLIRVESDEVTYPMHIILRYEIERGLMEGSVQVEDIPQLWNEKMVAYLGDRPPNDAQGCLQDVHWAAGLFGYFPTYTLGAMYATQLWECAKGEVPDLEAKVAAGDFKPLKAWLNEKIHKVGSLHPSGDALMKAATGSELQPAIFLKYLQAKYTRLYGL